MIVTAGKTNVSVYFYIVGDADNAKPGEPVTGLLFSDIETGGSASYVRQGAAKTDLTLITLASASAAHADGGFILVDDAIMPGVYRCDFADATFVTGVDEVSLQIVIAAGKNAVAAPIKVDITDFDLRTASVAQTANHTAAIADIPTVSEFNARTILTADYFDPAADTVANVTTVGTVSDGAKSAVATEARLSELDAANLPTDISAILLDTGELQTDWADGGRLDLLLDRLITQIDTATGEPGQGAPPVSAKMALKIDYLYKAWRNKKDSTATLLQIYNDAGTTVDQKATQSEVAGTTTAEEIISGP